MKIENTLNVILHQRLFEVTSSLVMEVGFPPPSLVAFPWRGEWDMWEEGCCTLKSNAFL